MKLTFPLVILIIFLILALVLVSPLLFIYFLFDRILPEKKAKQKSKMFDVNTFKNGLYSLKGFNNDHTQK
jgi:hypothetical protein